MKTFLASIIGIAACLSFISYANVQTKVSTPNQTPSDQNVALEKSQGTSSLLTLNQLSNQENAPQNTQPIITHTPVTNYSLPVTITPLEYRDDDYNERDYARNNYYENNKEEQDD